MGDFKLNPRFVAELARSQPVAAMLEDKAQRVAEVARTNGADLGSYPDTVAVDVGEVIAEDGTPTVAGRAYSTHEAAPYLEFGTPTAPKFAPLRRALDTLGGQS